MAYIPQIEFYKKRQFGDKLNMTFVFIRENAVPYLKMQLMISGVILLLLNILMNQISVGIFNFDMDNPESFDMGMLSSIFKLYGVIFLNAIVTGAIMPAVTYGYMKAYQKYPPNEIQVNHVTEALGSKIFNLVAYNILVAITVLISMFFFLIPALYLGVVLSLGSSIIIFEDENPLDAYGRCFKLIGGKWWSTFGLLVVMGILGYVISLLFGLPRTILFGLKAFTSFEEGAPDLSGMADMSTGEQVLSIIFSVFETFGAIITYSLSFIAIAFQYFNLVERKESRGLMSQIEGMDNEAQEADDEVY
ncbi:hypothetical protein BXY85_1286 [Roseivirga pacifica]|uniref:DUF7847 domain-containing protein n=1 Tax=Roseivirga pacifica TaxID=1267423 RepID=A0A1I0MDU4_9BACT|nr:hypothetical protein [Roseivirga pacifica]RKQ50272.1 hypothetical protein BXY85_1286 [Roseivirga pacifica]SEV85930.1 hypothetical protein SAMN05216290_0270 [Roseivirga pacifica]